ncbi:hypothetical protein LJR027_001957 [Terrabacter sp. LjRoot27]|uniref:hypothetical protein n=1 Tax=Terrabacter sp. LjRoot27 TaxID=3342306 RepID=UPI003ECC57E9
MMLVDCQTCPVRDVHCADCMVTALTAIPLRPGATAPGADTEGRDRAGTRPGRPRAVDDRRDVDGVMTAPLDRAERRAVSAFVAAGLVSASTANAARAELEPAEVVTHHRARRAV